MSNLPPRLEEIVEDFSVCVGQEKLEHLLHFAESLPELPQWLQGKRDEMDQVHECMTPVFVFAELENGSLTYHFDVPPESPTVRGYAAMLQEGVQGASPQEVINIPENFYLQTGLQKVLTGQRMNGMMAMLSHMKELARENLD